MSIGKDFYIQKLLMETIERIPFSFFFRFSVHLFKKRNMFQTFLFVCLPTATNKTAVFMSESHFLIDNQKLENSFLILNV